MADSPTAILPSVAKSGPAKGAHPREVPPGVRGAAAIGGAAAAGAAGTKAGAAGTKADAADTGDTVAIAKTAAVVPRQRQAVPPAAAKADDGSTAVIPRVPLAVTAAAATTALPATPDDREADTGALAGVILPGDQFVPPQTASRHIPPVGQGDEPAPVEPEEEKRGRSKAAFAVAGVAAAVVALTTGVLVINNVIGGDGTTEAATPIGSQGQYAVPPVVESSAASESPSPSPSASPSPSPSASPSPSPSKSPSKSPSVAPSSKPPANPNPGVKLQSLRMASSDRYVRASGNGVVVERLNGGSSAAARQEASFEVVAGLANAGCVSLRTSDGRYLRHYEYRIRVAADDGSALFKADATFCMQQAPGAMLLRSHNFPDHFLRARDGGLFIATMDRQSAGSMLWVLTDGLAG